MLFDDTYHTIAAPSEGLFKDRGSKFIGFAFPVKTEAEIKEHLAQLRKAHHGANHHCYAWRLGADKQSFRANDDGEPANSAGKPILGQIQAKDLTDVLVVVVRYFGGTLLGVSGLINAYRQAAAEALAQASVLEKQVMDHYRATFRFEQTSEVMKLMKQFDAKISEQGYDENSILEFGIRKNNSLAFEEKAKAHPAPFITLKYQYSR